MTQIEYKESPGSRLGNKQAAIYGSRLNELVEKRGFITPKIVVEDAKNTHSPLHDYFDWNDTNAAENWRLTQARELIRFVSITVVSDEKPTIRQFFSITPTKDMNTKELRVYVPVSTVMSNKSSRTEVIAYALRELDGWTQRYSQYSELFGVIKAIKTRMKTVNAEHSHRRGVACRSAAR